jgi:NAD(P)-dependent dehydrogenase (short-subunit alcohol dehydrogenase family)
MPTKTRSLNGKVAIVTGGTGGVGKALSKALARKGAKVGLCDLDPAKVEAAVAEIGSGVIGRAVDVTDAEAYSAFMDEVERELGPLDVLVNVAAIMPIGPFEAEKDSTTRRIVDINLTAVIISTKDAARRMKTRGSGHIVNVASGAGWVAGGGGATYVASKFGVVGYTESVALELHGSGIDISVMAPAVIKSEMSAGLKEVRGLRPSTPEEVAEAIIGGLERPRFAIFQPKAMGAMAFMFSAMPYRVRHALARLAKSDKLLLDFDAGARAAYEARVTAAPVASTPSNGKGKSAAAQQTEAESSAAKAR